MECYCYVPDNRFRSLCNTGIYSHSACNCCSFRCTAAVRGCPDRVKPCAAADDSGILGLLPYAAVD